MTWPPPSAADRVSATPGWYADPEHPGSQRFFDGAEWAPPAPRRFGSWLWAMITVPLGMVVSTLLVILTVAVRFKGGDLTTAEVDAILDDPFVLVAAAGGLWLTFWLAFAATTRRSGRSLRAAVATVPARWLAVSFLGGVLLQVAVVITAAAVGVEGANPFDSAEWGLGGALVVALVVGVGAPVFEELYFRGVLLPTLASRIPFPIANITQATFFGVLHADQGLFGVAVTALGGLFLGQLTHRSGSLRPAMSMHAGFNALAVVMLLVTS